jgi:hypothetical protein
MIQRALLLKRIWLIDGMTREKKVRHRYMKMLLSLWDSTGIKRHAE